MEFGGISTLDSAYYNTIGQSGTADKIKNTADKGLKSATDDELMSACKEFETYLLEQLFQEMRATINKAEESDSASVESMFEDNMYQEFAKNTVESGQLNIAQILYDQMKLNNTSIETGAAKA